MLTYAIIPAAGRGVRLGLDIPKQFLELQHKPLLIHTVAVIVTAPFINGAVLAVPEDFLAEAQVLVREHFGDRFPIAVIPGGKERQDSVWQALQQVPKGCEMVLIHDGVRPLITEQLLEATWQEARRSGAAIAAVPATDTVKRVNEHRVMETLPREEIWLVQTPQVFRCDILLAAYREARRCGWTVTDDASLVERMGFTVSVVHGSRTNLKITTREDLAWLRWYMDTGRFANDSHDE
jgi:2-C-methyl-D-erythritol 4-phosphate cytidylyltransferase